jgi:hypothetical protein
MPVAGHTQAPPSAADDRSDRYKWIALSNTTLGILMVTINQSILLISLPALFRGINLNPLSRPTRPTSCGPSWASCS